MQVCCMPCHGAISTALPSARLQQSDLHAIFLHYCMLDASFARHWPPQLTLQVRVHLMPCGPSRARSGGQQRGLKPKAGRGVAAARGLLKRPPGV